MGHGGISLITGRGNSHEDLVHAFKSVATHKIGGGIGGAIGNFSRGIGIRPAKKNKEKLTPERPTAAGDVRGAVEGTYVDEGEGAIDEETGLSLDSEDSSLKDDARASGAL